MEIKLDREVNNIDDILDSHFACYYINNKWIKNIKDSLNVIKKHINKEKSITKNEAIFIIQCLDVIINITVESNINKVFKKFINEYILIVKKWNDLLLESSLIENKISYLRRFLNDELTYSECLLVLKDSSNKLKQLKNWQPPSFRISKHYYNVLKEE